MKILHLKDTFEPKYMMRDEVQVAIHANKKNHEITVITSNLDSDLIPHPIDYFENQDKYIKEIKIIRSRGGKFPFRDICLYIPDKSLLNHYDIIHAHIIGSYSSFLGSMLKSISNIPLVLKADLSEAFYQRLKQNIIYKEFILYPAFKADSIITFTAKEKNYLVNLGVNPGKISVIPVGIDFEMFSKIEKKYSKSITIGFLGRFYPVKGLHNVITPLKKIISESSHVMVLFAGAQTDTKYAAKILGEFEGIERFSYIGPIDSSRIKDFYSNVDIVIIPSISETGSIVTLESMASGKAVIASDINTHREYIEHGVSGLLAKNEDEFYKYCKELINSDELRQMFCKNAQQKAKQYDWEKIFDKVEEVYSILSKPS